MNEQRMTDMVERLGDTLDPDVEALVAGGAARGRVRRRRRAVGSVVAGAAAVVVVGALGYAVAPGDEGVGTEEPSVASSSTPSSTDLTQAPREFGPDPEKMGWVLGDLLVGDVTRPRAWHERPAESSGFQAGSVLLNGAKVTVLLEHTEPRPPCGELPPGAECEVVLGGIVSWGTQESSVSGSRPTGVPHPRDDKLVGASASTATYATPDGFAITATAWSAADEKGAGGGSAAPALTEKQLVELVRNPVWLEAQE